MAIIGESPYVDAIERAITLLAAAFESGHTLLVFGNGGSAADAQHLTAELVGRFAADRRPLAAIALTPNQAVLTAWSNDRSFDDVFARQVEAWGVGGAAAGGVAASGTAGRGGEPVRRAGA